MAIKGDNAYNRDQTFWETYIKGRPAIPQSFFDLIFGYHAEHNGAFDTAHEVGAGVGVHSPRLASRFKHVVVSDIIPQNVETAKRRLTDGPYSFETSSLEDTIDVVPANSIDFVFASTMMHFCDIERAMAAVHHQLKPGGTFAAGLYGTYALSDPAAQEIWAKLCLWISEKIIEKFGFGDLAKLVLTNEASGLDCVGFPPQKFSPAVRYDWNYPTKDTMREMIVHPRFGIEPVSRIGPDDTLDSGWNRDWFTAQDINGLRAIADSWPHDEKHPEIIALWKDLHRVIGDKEVEGFWIVSVVMATKK